MSDVIEEAAKLARGELDVATFAAVVAALPVVAQVSVPRSPVWDAYVSVRGPLADLREALRLRLIDAAVYDLALHAMADAGHSA